MCSYAAQHSTFNVTLHTQLYCQATGQIIKCTVLNGLLSYAALQSLIHSELDCLDSLQYANEWTQITIFSPNRPVLLNAAGHL